MVCQLNSTGSRSTLSPDNRLSKLATGVIEEVEDYFQKYGLDEFRKNPKEESFYQNEGLSGIHWTTKPQGTPSTSSGSAVFKGVQFYNCMVAGLGSEMLTYERNGESEVFTRQIGNYCSGQVRVVRHNDTGTIDVRI